MKNSSIFSKVESNVQSYARAFPVTFDKAQGSEIWDTEGRRYLDFLAGCGSLNYGHSNPVMKEALIEYIQNDSIALGLDMHTAAKAQFLENIQDIILAPRELDYVVQFSGPTGTNAVEAALKLARKVTGRTNVICFTNAFHGVSMGALAATGNQYHRNGGGMPLSGTTRMPFDGYFGEDVDTIDYLSQMLGDPSSGMDFPAAVIVEAIQGEGGIRAARFEWLQRLQALCHKHDILLIVDDIQAGCGRTGAFFSFEQAGIKPDMVTLSKSLSGFGLPFSIVLIKRELDQWKPGEHNGTFRGNNHAFVTSAVAMDHYWRTSAFSFEMDAKTQLLEGQLHAFASQFPDYFTEVRGRGLMRGLVCADPTRAGEITAQSFKLGLIIERSGANDEVIKFLPALTITNAELTEGLDILGQAITDVCGLPAQAPLRNQTAMSAA